MAFLFVSNTMALKLINFVTSVEVQGAREHNLIDFFSPIANRILEEYVQDKKVSRERQNFLEFRFEKFCCFLLLIHQRQQLLCSLNPKRNETSFMGGMHRERPWNVERRKFCVKQKLRTNLEEVLGNSGEQRCLVVRVGQGHPAADLEESHCGKAWLGKPVEQLESKKT